MKVRLFITNLLWKKLPYRQGWLKYPITVSSCFVCLLLVVGSQAVVICLLCYNAFLVFLVYGSLICIYLYTHVFLMLALVWLVVCFFVFLLLWGIPHQCRFLFAVFSLILIIVVYHCCLWIWLRLVWAHEQSIFLLFYNSLLEFCSSLKCFMWVIMASGNCPWYHLYNFFLYIVGHFPMVLWEPQSVIHYSVMLICLEIIFWI